MLAGVSAAFRGKPQAPPRDLWQGLSYFGKRDLAATILQKYAKGWMARRRFVQLLRPGGGPAPPHSVRQLSPLLAAVTRRSPRPVPDGSFRQQLLPLGQLVVRPPLDEQDADASQASATAWDLAALKKSLGNKHPDVSNLDSDLMESQQRRELGTIRSPAGSALLVQDSDCSSSFDDGVLNPLRSRLVPQPPAASDEQASRTPLGPLNDAFGRGAAARPSSGGGEDRPFSLSGGGGTLGELRTAAARSPLQQSESAPGVSGPAASLFPLAELTSPKSATALRPSSTSGQGVPPPPTLNPISPKAQPARLVPPAPEAAVRSVKSLAPVRAPPPHVKPGSLPMQQQRLEQRGASSTIARQPSSGLQPTNLSSGTGGRSPKAVLQRTQSIGAANAPINRQDVTLLRKSTTLVPSRSVRESSSSGVEAGAFNVIHAQVMSVRRGGSLMWE